VERVLREFLRCGLLEHGFARLWCSECRRSVLVASLSGTHADLSFFGMTDEDRFCGVTSPGGIAKIFIGNAATSIEVDHLQYGLEPVTEPATLGLLGLGVVALISRRRT
jgi:hypothetical protein